MDKFISLTGSFEAGLSIRAAWPRNLDPTGARFRGLLLTPQQSRDLYDKLKAQADKEYI